MLEGSADCLDMYFLILLFLIEVVKDLGENVFPITNSNINY